ncbi:MAG TPA: serine/threonine-protein kinase, partial [Kofleriaceae bacterium]|nr:serine/threonine-protein kinase [Kofleriaceae bacterium]
MAWQYRLGPRIGRGGMADVFLAVQAGEAGFAKLVVLKRVRPDAAGQAELTRSFFDEARVLARLSHPNLVQVLEVGCDGGGPFVVVEYLPGETLLTVMRDLAATGGRLPWPVVCRIGADLAAGLAAAHGAVDSLGRPARVLHRDLTPSNVIVCYSGAVKLIDFGIAKAEGDSDTLVGLVKGKLSYLAPELLRGGRPDTRSDLYQLGVVLHEALCGRRLFEAADDAARVRAVLGREVPRVRHLVPRAPEELDDLIAALLERDPARRPGSAEQVRRALEEAARRADASMSAHELGDWMKRVLPVRHAERMRCEGECLGPVAGADDAATAEVDEVEIIAEHDPDLERTTLSGGPFTLVAAGAPPVPRLPPRAEILRPAPAEACAPPPRGRRWRWSVVAALVAAALVAATAGVCVARLAGQGAAAPAGAERVVQSPIVRPLEEAA